MHFSVPQYTGIWDVHQIASKILWDVCCVTHLLTGCHYCMSIIHPLFITLFGLSVPHSWLCLHSRHKLPPFFNTHSFSDMLLHVNLGWCCMICMIACYRPAGKDVSWAETLCADMWYICTKTIAWHLPSPSLLDSHTTADFINSPLIVAVVFRNPKRNMGTIMYMIFLPFYFFNL